MSLFSYRPLNPFATGKPTLKSVAKDLGDAAMTSLDRLANTKRVREIKSELDEKRAGRNRTKLLFHDEPVCVNVSVLMNDEMFGVEMEPQSGLPSKSLTMICGDHFRGADGVIEKMKPYMAYLNIDEISGADLISFIESNRLGRPVMRGGKPVVTQGLGGKGVGSVLYQFNPKRLYELDPDGFFYQKCIYDRMQTQSDLRNCVRFEDGHVYVDSEHFDPLHQESNSDLDMEF